MLLLFGGIFALTPRWYQGRGRRQPKGKASEVGMVDAGDSKDTLAHMKS